jgi:hypothetical protein
MKKSLALFVLALAACGGGSAKPATTGPAKDPIPMAENPQPPDTTKPDEPAKPTEPAKPSGPDPAKVKADLLAAEQAAFDKAKPVFDKWCAKCHTKGGKMTAAKKLDHFDMTTYPFAGHHAMELGVQIRKSLGIDGSKPTMPFDKKGAVKGDELVLISAWADAFDASHKGGAHEGHGDGEHGEHEDGHGDHKH